MFLTAGTMVVDGGIGADGSISAGSASGDGSGGTVNIATGSLAGTGTITANGGGNGSHVGGAGEGWPCTTAVP